MPNRNQSRISRAGVLVRVGVADSYRRRGG